MIYAFGAIKMQLCIYAIMISSAYPKLSTTSIKLYSIILVRPYRNYIIIDYAMSFRRILNQNKVFLPNIDAEDDISYQYQANIITITVLKSYMDDWMHQSEALNKSCDKGITCNVKIN